MEPKVTQTIPAARLCRPANRRRVGGDAANTEFRHQTFGIRREPIRMPGLANRAAVKAHAQRGKECARNPHVKG
jgi:hypothetical protein